MRVQNGDYCTEQDCMAYIQGGPSVPWPRSPIEDCNFAGSAAAVVVLVQPAAPMRTSVHVKSVLARSYFMQPVNHTHASPCWASHQLSGSVHLADTTAAASLNINPIKTSPISQRVSTGEAIDVCARKKSSLPKQVFSLSGVAMHIANTQ